MRSSHTSRDRPIRSRRFYSFTGLALLLCLCTPVYALDPNRSPSEYLYDEWGSDQGLNCGAVRALAQTPDGYLWIGCEEGLVRFDGIRFQMFSSREGNIPPGAVQQLATDGEGNLWIRRQDLSLLRYRDGKVENVLRTVSELSLGATAMYTGVNEDTTFWARSDGVWRYRKGNLRSLYRAPTTRPNLLVIALAETATREIWLGSRDAGLFSLRDGNLQEHVNGLPDLKVNTILPTSGQQLWIGTDAGAVIWDGMRLTQSRVPLTLRDAEVVALSKDREGNIWTGTSEALFRVDARGGAVRMRTDKIARVNAIFEDREGNLWLGTDAGLARFRDSAFLSYAVPGARRRGETNGPLFVDGQGRTWFSTVGGAVQFRRGAERGEIRLGDAEDSIYSISGSRDHIWIGRKKGGLTLIRCHDTCLVERSWRQADGLAQDSITSVLEDRDGTVWAGTASAGVSEIGNRQITNWNAGSGLNSNSINAIAQTSDGTIWFATPEGLSAEHGRKWNTYTGVQGLPPGGINCLTVDEEPLLWVGGAAGLAYLRSGEVHPVRWASWPGEQIVGLQADRHGSLWVVTQTRILQVKRAAALSGFIQRSDVREYGAADGLLTGLALKRSPIAATDRLGRVWFSTSRGVSVVDPSRLNINSAAVIPHIQAIWADGFELPFTDRVNVPALRRRLVFQFVGLNLTVPERVQYAYKLDPFDHDWSKPASSREAVYTNLPPGDYRFLLRTSNEFGGSIADETSMSVRIEPAFWQTWWFRGAFLAIAALALAMSYRQRVQNVRSALNLRFEERLSERTRIARELHDTLLQGFLSASMQLHVARNRLDGSSPAKAPLERAMELMRKASDEGRAALRQMRSDDADATSLETAFSLIPHEAMIGDDVSFRLRVEGTSRGLRPILRDDVYRICREGIVNAIRHSGAKDIEVEISYQLHQLCVTVQDNGRGIDPQVIRAGRDGHWGIQGMRERAERIKAKLSLLSSPGAGTEMVLRIPGNVAYESRSSLKNNWAAIPFRLNRMLRKAAMLYDRKGQQNPDT